MELKNTYTERTKCKDCDKEYTMFLLKNDVGYTKDNFPCPDCRSIEKEP